MIAAYTVITSIWQNVLQMSPYLILRITMLTTISRLTVKVHCSPVACRPRIRPHPAPSRYQGSAPLHRGARRRQPRTQTGLGEGRARVEVPGTCASRAPDNSLPNAQGPSALTPGPQPLLPHRPGDAETASTSAGRNLTGGGVIDVHTRRATAEDPFPEGCAEGPHFENYIFHEILRPQEVIL